MRNPITYVAAIFALAGMFVCYQAGYTQGGNLGYAAGVSQHQRYERGGDMAADWYTYRVEHKL
jgi:hypothetical protein